MSNGRTSIHAPLTIEFPTMASSLYAILVPHNNPYHVDYWMVAKSEVFSIRFPENISTYNCWWFKGNRERDGPDLQQWLDFLSLSQTCKHACKWLKLRVKDLNGILYQYWHSTIRQQWRFSMPATKWRTWIMPQLMTQRAFACVFLDRLALAQWYTPSYTVVDWHALDLVLRPRPPMVPGSHMPLPSTDVNWQFLVVASADSYHKSPQFQRRIWLALAIQSYPQFISRTLVKLAGQDPLVLAWFRASRFLEHRAFARAKEVCEKHYMGEKMNTAKRKRAISAALAMLDGKKGEQLTLDDVVRQ